MEPPARTVHRFHPSAVGETSAFPSASGGFALAGALVAGLLAAGPAAAATHHLQGLTSTVVNIVRATELAAAPGDTLAIPAGTYAAGLRFIGFEGDSLRPIVVTNSGGLVVIQAPSYNGISFQRSRHIHLTGSGDPDIERGIVVDTVAGGGVGVSIGDLSSDFEVDHLEIRHTGFAGIMAKTDPSCTDSATWRSGGFVLRNLRIHHNHIHDTHGEGMYIGYTGGYLVTSKKVCDGRMVFGHWLEDVEVAHNLVERAGWDGIQLSLVRRRGSVHHNKVHNYGLAEEPQQNFGLTIGGGEYSVHANIVVNDSAWGPRSGSGMQFLNATSGSSITHNVFSYSGGYGIFIHNRNAFDDPKRGYAVDNNTVAFPVKSAIFYNDAITESFDTTLVGTEQTATPYLARNNLVLSPVVDYQSQNFWKKDPETYLDFNTKAERDAHLPGLLNNLGSRRPDTLGLASPRENDFRIARSTSPLIDRGLDLPLPPAATDPLGTILPRGTTLDLGALEFDPSAHVSPRPRPLPLPTDGFRHDLLGRRTPSTPGQLRILTP